jgi:outer membrane cobalamin receptor
MFLKRLSGYPVIRLSVTLLLFALFFSASFAAEVPRFYGEEVVVTALRVPQLASKLPWTTSVISSKELESFIRVGDALRIVPGIDTISNGYLGALTSVRLRGANASQVLILVDGHRINSPTLGMFDMGDLLVDNIEKIEVVRAPLSAIYGSEAVSGVINIITRSPQKLERSLSLSGGSFGTQQYKFSIGNERYCLIGDYLKSDGFRTNSGYLAKNIYGKMNLPLGWNQFGFDYAYYDAVKGVPGVPTSDADPTSATEPNDRQYDKNAFASASFSGKDFKLKLYHNSLDQKVDPAIWGTTSTKTWQTGVEWQQNFNLGLGKFLYGLEARSDAGKATWGTLTTIDNTIQNYAVFVQDMIEEDDRYALTAGIRADQHSVAGTSVNPRLGLVFEPIKDLMVKASVGTAFRAPTLNDLYYNDGMMFGDPQIKPEKSFSYELGLERQIAEKTTAWLNYFSSDITDLILWNWEPSTGITRVKNVGEVQSEGVEFELTRLIGSEGKGFVNFTYQKATDKKDVTPALVDKAIPYIPQLKYNAGLMLVESSLIIKHVGERYADAYNNVKLPAYTVVDLKLGKRLSAVLVEFTVENLFDEKYSETVGSLPYAPYSTVKYPMPGRRYRLGLKWDI